MSQHSPGPSLMATMLQVIGRFLYDLGPLRVALVVLSLILMVFAPGLDTPVRHEGLGLVRTVLLPPLAPLFLAGLLLDALMSKMMMGDADAAGRQRLRMIIRTELIVAAMLLIAWLPFIWSVGR